MTTLKSAPDKRTACIDPVRGMSPECRPHEFSRRTARRLCEPRVRFSIVDSREPLIFCRTAGSLE